MDNNIITQLPIPPKGINLELLVEGSEIGCTYYRRIPFNNPPTIAYAPEIMRIFNKVLQLNPEEVQLKYGEAIKTVIQDLSITKGKSFVFDLTMYLNYIRSKFSVTKFTTIANNFEFNINKELKSNLGYSNILVYVLDDQLVRSKINLRKSLIFNVLFALRNNKINLIPFDKVIIYNAEGGSFHLIVDTGTPLPENAYANALMIIKNILSNKIVIDDEEAAQSVRNKKALDMKDIRANLQPNPESKELNTNTGILDKIKSVFSKGKPEDAPQDPKDPQKPNFDQLANANKTMANIQNPTIFNTPVPDSKPSEPSIYDNAIIDRGDNLEEKPIVKKVKIPVAKRDPIKKSEDEDAELKDISKSDIEDAIKEIAKNTKSFLANYNIKQDTIESRLDAYTRAKPKKAVEAVDAVETDDKDAQIKLAQEALVGSKELKTVLKELRPGEIPDLTPNLIEQEETSKVLGYEKEESFDKVNDSNLIHSMMKNNIGMALARRHGYKERIVHDLTRSASTRLSEIGYKVAKVYYSDSSSKDTEMYPSDFDIINIKCLTPTRKTVTLKFRVPQIKEDRYVISGGLKWFFPSILATLPIFIVRKNQSQIKTNYSSISFNYGIFNKQEDVRCFVGGFKIPLTLLYGLILGIEGVLQHYNIQYQVVDMKLRGKLCFPLANEKWLAVDFDKNRVDQRCILTGLRLACKKYLFKSLSSVQDVYMAIKAYTGAAKSEYILSQTIKYLIDVQTEKVLASNNLPTTLKEIIPYCAELAMSGRTSDKLSIENVYLKTTDIIVDAVERGVAQGVSNFKRKHMYDPDKEVSVDQSFVTKFFRDKGALQQLQEQNPIEEVSNYAAVRIAGPGGLPNPDAIMPRDRAVRNSHFGNLDPTDTSEGDPGSRIFLSLGHMYDQNQNGFMPMAISAKNTQIMGPALSCTPYVDADDQARGIMAANQARQTVPVVSSESPIVSTGAETLIPAMCSSTFAKKADEDGVVTYVDNNVIIVQGKSGKSQCIDIRPSRLISGSGKNAALTFTPLVKPGDKVDKFKILASNQYVKPTLTQGVNALTAYMSYMGYNYEDGFVISESFANRLTSIHHDQTEITLLDNDQIEIFPKIGDKFEKGDTILRVKKSIVGDMALSDDYEIIAPDKCEITGVKFFPNGNLNQIMNLIDYTDQYYAQTNKMIANAGGKRLFDKKYLLENAGKFTDHNEVFKGNKVIIESISYMPARLGDKLTNRHGGKGVITKILPDELMPHTESGKVIDVIYHSLCVVGRMNVGQLHECASGKLMNDATNMLKDMVDKGASRPQIEKFIIDLYSNLDNTDSKTYSTGIARNLKSMDDRDFQNYVTDSIKNKLKLIVPPFQGDTVDQVVNTANKMGLKLAEKLYLPELGPNVKTKYPVALGILYFQRLEQIAGIKSHARNVGRYIKTTMNPTRGKARAGGQKMGEMDSWCMLSYGSEGKDVLREMYAVSADNQNVKSQVLSDIIRNGKADISEDVELSGSGEYFNAVCTAMGIDTSA